MSAAGTTEALRDLAVANMANAKDYFKDQIDELSEACAEASSTFQLASSKDLTAACVPFMENLEHYLDGLGRRLTSDPVERDRLKLGLAVPRAYLAGWIEGGGVYVAIQRAFPEGDWDEPIEVKKVLHRALGFVETGFVEAVLGWANSYQAPEPSAPSKSKPATPSAIASAASTSRAPAPERPPRKPTRLEALLAFAEGMGVRIKSVPENASDSWVSKLEVKLRQVAVKKKIPFDLGEFDDVPEDDDYTSTQVGPAEEEDPAAIAARRERIETMLQKAEKAELKLGRIPEDPTDAWLDETEAKLKVAVERRREKRKAERERKAKQRKDRIAKLERSAAQVGIELGKIPPFPTDDWIARSEMRVATQMLRQTDEEGQDTGRAERLTRLLGKAAELGVDLDVPPDPDAEWFQWAEGKVAEAEASDELLMAGEAEDARDTPVLYYEEGTVQEQSWRLEGTTLTIGRTRKNDVALPHDAQISREHCVLRLEGSTWIAEDLGSTRGTLVNGKAIKKPTNLVDGDAIQCGDTVLVFRANA